MQRTLAPLRRNISFRPLSTSTRLSASPFTRGPAPPRLPKDEQDLFEKLQKASTGAFSTPRPDASSSSQSPSTKPTIRPQINQSPHSSPSTSTSTSPSSTTPTTTSSPQINQSPDSTSTPSMRIKEGEDLHPNMRRGAPPEFEGDVNPKTGEVGGPKNEPLRWGGGADWSYNGRVTDF